MNGTSRGTTVIELLVSVVVFATMLGAFFVFYRSQTLALAQQERTLNTKENAQLGMDFLTRELRTAGARPRPESFAGCGVAASTSTTCFGVGGVGFPRFASANATTIRLLADARGNSTGSAADGCPDDANEDVTYTYNSGTGQLLRRPGTGSWTPVIDGISAFRFRYFTFGTGDPPPYVEVSGNLTANQIAQLTHVVIELTTRATSVIPGTPAVTSAQTSTVDLRNPPC
jgi:hypothetical protein